MIRLRDSKGRITTHLSWTEARRYMQVKGGFFEQYVDCEACQRGAHEHCSGQVSKASCRCEVCWGILCVKHGMDTDGYTTTLTDGYTTTISTLGIQPVSPSRNSAPIARVKPIILLNWKTLDATGFDYPRLAAIFMWGRDFEDYLMIIGGQFVRPVTVDLLVKGVEECIAQLSTLP